MNRIRRTLPISMILVILSACSGGSTTSSLPQPVTAQNHGRIVAPTGDTESELRANIAQAQAAGDTVRVVSVTNGSATHLFSPYALVVRSSKALITFAYNQVFVWPLDRMSLSYGGTNLALNTLPSVTTPILDAQVQSSGKVNRPKARAAFCPDCAALYSAKNAKISQIGRGLQDSWQVNPDYVAFQSTVKTRAPQEFVSVDSSCSGGTFINNYCYGPAPGPNPGPVPVPVPASTPQPGSTCAKQSTTIAFNLGSATAFPVTYFAPFGIPSQIGFDYFVPPGVERFTILTKVTFIRPGGVAGETLQTPVGIKDTLGVTGFLDALNDADEQWSSTQGSFDFAEADALSTLYGGTMTSQCPAGVASSTRRVGGVHA